jgi:hypothetical protein
MAGSSTSIEVTRHQMIGGDFFLLRLDLRALWHGEGTARLEAATRGRAHRIDARLIQCLDYV